jgi:hypothetical protein
MMTHVVHVLARRWRFSQSLGKRKISIFHPKFLFCFVVCFLFFFGSCLFFISHFGFSSISVLTCTFFILDVSNESRTNWIFIRLRVYFFSLLSHVATCFVFILHRYICPDRKRNGKERNKMSINPMTRLT